MWKTLRGVGEVWKGRDGMKRGTGAGEEGAVAQGWRGREAGSNVRHVSSADWETGYVNCISQCSLMACPRSGRLSAHVPWLCAHAGSNRGSSGYSRRHIPIPDRQMKCSRPKLRSV